MTQRRTRSPAAALLLLALAGCSADMALYEGQDDGDTAGGVIELPDLRLDVHPSDASAGLLPQSIPLLADAEWTGMQIEVRPTVTISGFVTGFEAAPAAVGGIDTDLGDPTVPGQDDVPVAARVEVALEGSVAGGTASTDALGAFRLQVPTGEGYRLVVLPEESDLLPFEVRNVLLLASDLALDELYLDYGAPVWGQVTRTDGAPVPGVTVQLVDAATGAEGPRTEVDDQGWYMLRAYPGSYELVVRGEEASSDPTVRAPLAFAGEEGARLDFDLGPTRRMQVEGTLVDEAGERLGGEDERCIVRLTAESLSDLEGELVVETTSDQFGRFELEAMAGTYLLEVIPDFDAPRSPVSHAVTVTTAAVDMGELPLPARVPWSAQVLGPEGEPASQALVVARELGFDGYTYSATTGDDGLLALELPATPVELTITPSDTSAAITHLVYDPSDALTELRLAAGTLVSGTLLSAGEPVPFALIEVRDEDGRLYATTLSDAEGAFALRVEDEPSQLP
ncbi:carboxypeptidase-like regulatory domain-containing protein [Myxococcota bacterium]|nr:carboxypeptidase-like regulatory domain-containing protein [Myxococcota bacterium]